MKREERETMANLRVQRRRPNGTERGATLVEFALLLPVFVTLLLGLITGGIATSQKNSLENSVREGTRYGAVYPVTSGSESTYLAAVITEVVAAATGDLDADVAGQFVCAAYVDEDGDIFRRVVSSGSATDDTGSLCFADGRSEARIQAFARRNAEIETLLKTFNVTLDARSVTRYER